MIVARPWRPAGMAKRTRARIVPPCPSVPVNTELLPPLLLSAFPLLMNVSSEGASVWVALNDGVAASRLGRPTATADRRRNHSLVRRTTGSPWPIRFRDAPATSTNDRVTAAWRDRSVPRARGGDRVAELAGAGGHDGVVSARERGGVDQLGADAQRGGARRDVLAGGLGVHAPRRQQLYVGQRAAQRLQVLGAAHRRRRKDLHHVGAGLPRGDHLGRRQRA